MYPFCNSYDPTCCAAAGCQLGGCAGELDCTHVLLQHEADPSVPFSAPFEISAKNGRLWIRPQWAAAGDPATPIIDQHGAQAASRQPPTASRQPPAARLWLFVFVLCFFVVCVFFLQGTIVTHAFWSVVQWRCIF